MEPLVLSKLLVLGVVQNRIVRLPGSNRQLHSLAYSMAMALS